MSPNERNEEPLKILVAWREQAEKLEGGEITREEYDKWRYFYPKFDTTQRWGEAPSQAMSDVLVDILNDQLEE